MMRWAIRTAAVPLLVLATADASAQVAVALSAGVNRGSWDSSVHSFFHKDQRSIIRSHAGLSATIPVWGSVLIDFGAAYSQKGARVEVTGATGTGPVVQTVTFEADYMELTALARVNQPLVENRVLAFVAAGPAVAWKLSLCEFRYVSAHTDPNEIVRTCPTRGHPYEPEYFGLDYGLAYGGGLEVGVTGTLGLTVGIMNSVGLRNLLADKHSHGDHLKLRTATYRGGIVYRIR